jgi:hypothetical protein
MALEDRIRERIEELVQMSEILSVGLNNGQTVDERRRGECSAWLTSAQHVVHLLFISPETPYRRKADAVADKEWGYMVHEGVAELGAVLRNLLWDANAGLLGSVLDHARAETFDDFLDHAESYMGKAMKNEAGVIAGVVFEDSLRRVCRKKNIPEAGVKLDLLVTALSNAGTLSAVKAKRARAAADVRTKATHAQWNDFELSDVEATIVFTREFISRHLDA